MIAFKLANQENSRRNYILGSTPFPPLAWGKGAGGIGGGLLLADAVFLIPVTDVREWALFAARRRPDANLLPMQQVVDMKVEQHVGVGWQHCQKQGMCCRRVDLWPDET